MAGLTLDAGALVAADRNDRRFWSYWAEAVARGVVSVIPAPALSQAWRTGRQARLAQVVNASIVESLDESGAKRSGELCAASKTSDVVDAAVVVSAARRGDVILTNDPKDLRKLASAAGGVQMIKL